MEQKIELDALKTEYSKLQQQVKALNQETNQPAESSDSDDNQKN